MNFFRTLQAAVDPRTETYTGSGRIVQDAPAEPDATAADRHLFAAMAYFDEHPGVPDHTDPALANLLKH